MRSATSLGSSCICFATVTILVAWFLVFPMPAAAQGTQGQNGVYDLLGQNVVGSYAFIDATMFAGKVQNPDFCKVLNYVLVNVDRPPTYPNGAVIDARGLLSSTPATSMTCTASPWAGITSPPPSTILLPSGTIVIPSPGWVLPANTRIIGVGDGDIANPDGSATYSGTTIQACKTGQTPSCSPAFTSGGTMISMCSSACTGVSIENLSLDGQSQQINGIVNGYAGSPLTSPIWAFPTIRPPIPNLGKTLSSPLNPPIPPIPLIPLRK